MGREGGEGKVCGWSRQAQEPGVLWGNTHKGVVGPMAPSKVPRAAIQGMGR